MDFQRLKHYGSLRCISASVYCTWGLVEYKKHLLHLLKRHCHFFKSLHLQLMHREYLLYCLELLFHTAMWLKWWDSDEWQGQEKDSLRFWIARGKDGPKGAVCDIFRDEIKVWSVVGRRTQMQRRKQIQAGAPNSKLSPLIRTIQKHKWGDKQHTNIAVNRKTNSV